MFSYRIVPASPSAHLFKVELDIGNPDADGVLLTLPAWIPGSYMIRDFARNLVSISAQSAGKQVVLDKIDKQTWRAQPCCGPLTVSYEIYAWDLSVRGAHLDQTHGYFNGTSVFLKIVGGENEPCEVELIRPDGAAYTDWRVATTLAPVDAQKLGFGRFRAANYAELIDHPVEMGTFAYAQFRAAGVEHGIAITGRHKADMERLSADLKIICEHHAAMFGGLPEMPGYLFQVMAVGEGYGGLEHRTSTSLICKRDDLPIEGDTQISEGYRRFLGLCSHEYFHLWNVKRISPEVFQGADLASECYTRQLWAFEGITSYYDDISLVRSGLIDAAGYLDLLSKTITRVMRGSGRLKQSVSDSSFDAWTKFYKQDENAANAIVSYYTKGSLVAFALDLKIRSITAGRKSLDDVMRLLWNRYGLPGKGVPEGGVEQSAEMIAGESLEEFFDQTLRGTRDIPLAALFDMVGVGFSLRPQRDSSDQGGYTKDAGGPPGKISALGARYKGESVGVRLTALSDGGTAQASGLAAGDLLVALDGLMVTEKTLEKHIGRLGVGSSVSAHAFRRDELMEFEVTLLAAPDDTCELWLLENIDSATEQRRGTWLNLTA